MQAHQKHEDHLITRLEIGCHKTKSFILSIQEQASIAEKTGSAESTVFKKRRQDQEFFEALHESFIQEMEHNELLFLQQLEKLYSEKSLQEEKLKTELAQKKNEEEYFEELTTIEINMHHRQHEQVENTQSYLKLLEYHITELNNFMIEIGKIKDAIQIDIDAQLQKITEQYTSLHKEHSEIREITLPPIPALITPPLHGKKTAVVEEKEEEPTKNILKFDMAEIHALLINNIPKKLLSGEISAHQIKSTEHELINQFFKDRLTQHYHEANPTLPSTQIEEHVNMLMNSPRCINVIDGVAKKAHNAHPTIDFEAAKLSALKQNLKNANAIEKTCISKMATYQDKIKKFKASVNHQAGKGKMDVSVPGKNEQQLQQAAHTAWVLKAQKLATQTEESRLNVNINPTQKSSESLTQRYLVK